MKYLLFILSVICFFGANAQTRPSGNPTQFNTGRQKWGWSQSDSGTILPIYSSLPAWTPTFPYTTIGVRTISDTSIYFWTGLTWKLLVGSSGGGSGVLTGSNGLNVVGTDVRLGGVLTQNTDIDANGDSLRIIGNGYTMIRTNSSSWPTLTVENTNSGFKDNTYFIGQHVPIRLFAKASNGFPGFTFYSGPGDTLRAAIGYDGNFSHFYLLDLRNTASATMEVDGSPFAAWTRTRHFGIGTIPTPDTAIINMLTVPSGATRDSILFYATDRNGTFNTSGGAISHKGMIIDIQASRSAGGSNLTNIALFLRARNAQTNHALFVDSGKVTIHNVGLSSAIFNMADFQTVANLGVTQDRTGGYFEMGKVLTDTLGGSQTFSAVLYGRATYAVKGLMTIPDNLQGPAFSARLTLQRNTAYSGATIIQGSNLPANGATTMPSVASFEFNSSQSNTGGNSVREQGWWGIVSAHAIFNAGNSTGKLVFFNGGAFQTTGGTVDTGYIFYANTLPSMVTKKYAFFGEGSADTLYSAGVIRFSGLAFQNDTTSYKPMAVSSNGTVVRMIGWPTGSSGSGMAIGGAITSATQGSVLFAGTGGILEQSNANFFYDSTNARLGLKTSSPSATEHILNTSLGTSQVNTAGLLLQNNTAAAAGAQQISPAIRWSAQGWKTNATAASQEVDVRAYVLPVQGSAAPTGYLTFEQSINGGAYTATILTVGVNSAGRVGIGITPDTQDPLIVAGGIKLAGGSTIRVLPLGSNGFGVNDGTWKLFIDGSNRIGVNNNSSPTAYVHLPAGTATASTAPLKFTSGTNLTSAEAGAMEWNGTNLFITQTSGPTRKTIAYTTDVLNIGNSDLTATANRTLSFNGTKQFTFDSATYVNISGPAPTLRFRIPSIPKEYIGAILSGSPQDFEFGFTHNGSFDIGPSYIVDTLNNFSVSGAVGSQPLYSSGGSLTAGNGFVSAKGNFYRVNNITTNTTIDLTYYFMTVDCTSGNVTINLPAASTAFGGNVGIQYVFKRMDASANTITVQGAGADTIDGATSFTIVGQYTVREIQCTSSSVWSIK